MVSESAVKHTSVWMLLDLDPCVQDRHELGPLPTTGRPCWCLGLLRCVSLLQSLTASPVVAQHFSGTQIS
jgi:hypothetical protein